MEGKAKEVEGVAGMEGMEGLEEATFVSLLRTANLLSQGIAEVLRPSGLTPTQYSVLRILRGGSRPLTCGEMGERMIARDPDVTRILDRLERQGFIARTRSQEDRRVVVTEITAEGKELVDSLEEPMERLHREQLGHLGTAKLRNLAELLDEARERCR